MSSGGKRTGAGRKPGLPTSTHPVRCTDEGWEWLQSQASGKGHTSVGKWADSAGRKAPKRKGNAKACNGATTRQQRWQLAKQAKGLCQRCGKQKNTARVLCDVCAPVRKRRNPEKRLWLSVDWRLSDMEIAESMGVCQRAPYYHRKKLLQGKPIE